jgi:biopolymer transport protein ExbD
MQKSERARRMEKRHKRAKRGGELNLVSMMDIFTILVFFLLVNSSDVEVLSNPADIQLPQSIAEDKPRVSVVVLIGDEQILVQGKPVAEVADVLTSPGNDIPGLREALLLQNDRELADDGEDAIAGREVTIMGDKEIPYRVLKKVMATCTASDYGQISLAVLQKDAAPPGQVAAVR